MKRDWSEKGQASLILNYLFYRNFFGSYAIGCFNAHYIDSRLRHIECRYRNGGC